MAGLGLQPIGWLRSPIGEVDAAPGVDRLDGTPVLEVKPRFVDADLPST